MPVLAALTFVLQVAVNTPLGYRLTLPDGFVAFPEGRTQRDVVDYWTEVMPYSQNGALVLCLQRMRGTLARGRMRREDVPASAQLKTYKWKGFEIDGFRSDTVQGGTPVVILAAQVPLRREAIQLILAGPHRPGARHSRRVRSTGAAPLGARGEARLDASQFARHDRFRLPGRDGVRDRAGP